VLAYQLSQRDIVVLRAKVDFSSLPGFGAERGEEYENS
jgi:hypothetical protein